MKNFLRVSHLYLPYLIFTLPERALVLNKRLNVKEFQTVFAFTEKPSPLKVSKSQKEIFDSPQTSKNQRNSVNLFALASKSGQIKN